jgi:hypothetical protein
VIKPFDETELKKKLRNEKLKNRIEMNRNDFH